MPPETKKEQGMFLKSVSLFPAVLDFRTRVIIKFLKCLCSYLEIILQHIIYLLSLCVKALKLFFKSYTDSVSENFLHCFLLSGKSS